MSESRRNINPDVVMTVNKRCDNCQKLVFFNRFVTILLI